MSAIMCSHCEVVEAQRIERHYTCAFCLERLWRLRAAYKRAGRRFSTVNLHRAYKHWRQTPELDALYLEPIERAA